jgi:hypothetical protein
MRNIPEPSRGNPYAAPSVPVADIEPAKRDRPPRVARAVTLLWIAYALSLVHVGLALDFLTARVDLRIFIGAQSVSFLLYAWLIYSIGRGRHWARLMYLILMGVRVVNVGRMLPADLRTSHLAVVVTAISLVCQCVALYWLFTEPGRAWFQRVDELG